MSKTLVACPHCGGTGTRRNGRDRQGRQIHQYRGCRRRFTARSATPFSGYRFPPDLIALAVRWYLRHRLSFAADATAFFRRAIAATGVIPDEATTDGAAACPPALAAALPPVAHEVGKRVQQRIERDHQHLKGRLRPLRGFKTLAGARALCAARLPAQLTGRLLRPRATDRHRGLVPAAGGAGVGRPSGCAPGSLMPATTRFPRRACPGALCAAAITARPNETP